MFGIENYSIFIISSIILSVTPGSDTFYVLGNSISSGRKVGVMSALGTSTGCILHTVMAALGLSVILAKSAIAFNIVKYLGAIYLIFLGVRTLMSKTSLLAKENKNEKKSIRQIFLQGAMIDVLNPKVALFFLAFLPQFINPNTSYGIIPFLVLGFTYIIVATIWCITLAVFLASISRKISEIKGMHGFVNKFTGIIFVGLGLNLLTAKLKN
ncbi:MULTISPECIES: LysE family translocator [unclassified Clostridium]|uniref:LysE family translocator n=1 Tax=unclassified Clostridium TaxID=2614128 RepID=UPI0002974B37|nr:MULTISPECIES: LysE family translocator [unclassified Clostridium]EKQ56061.1 MAG: putative threonine efflux protein [Clostridium sp. Maddingley MBC34-26]